MAIFRTPFIEQFGRVLGDKGNLSERGFMPHDGRSSQSIES